MFYRFRFESEFYPTLSRVPLHLRMKLDLAGVKFSLQDWLAFSFEERTALCHFPVDEADERQAFVAYLDFLARKYRGEPVALAAPLDRLLWDHRIPEPVAAKSAARNQTVTAEEWSGWPSGYRYALYKTAISKSEPEAFFELLQELREAKR
jgi:hypothetical protein